MVHIQKKKKKKKEQDSKHLEGSAGQMAKLKILCR